MIRKTALLLLALLVGLCAIDGAPRKRTTRKKRARTHRVVRKKPQPKPSVHDVNPFVACEDTCCHVHGIDVSHYQEEVFWESVGDHTNMAYVYLKCTEGSDNIDPRYERNIDMAHRHGLKVGSYHFFRPKVDLQLQLKNFKAQCLPGEQDLIPMLDVESTGGLETEQFCDSLLKFLGMMEEAYHQKPLIYTYRNFYNKYLLGRVDDYQLMVAMYADEQPVLADGRDYTLWQYTCKGRLTGVAGEVDKSRFTGEHCLREIRYQR